MKASYPAHRAQGGTYEETTVYTARTVDSVYAAAETQILTLENKERKPLYKKDKGKAEENPVYCCVHGLLPLHDRSLLLHTEQGFTRVTLP